ncbi:hypothetical protein HBB16_14985 [Pseudonocardia sp. MCCB 268]|nr:hypothetical protein [Pseudonocardia cytotoxica]
MTPTVANRSPRHQLLADAHGRRRFRLPARAKVPQAVQGGSHSQSRHGTGASSREAGPGCSSARCPTATTWSSGPAGHRHRPGRRPPAGGGIAARLPRTG